MLPHHSQPKNVSFCDHITKHSYSKVIPLLPKLKTEVSKLQFAFEPFIDYNGSVSNMAPC